ncbi:hypothetical protein [Natrinema salsiterrestre]|uniref:Uncharacterized protein n=1 Tax=Natrinema salsiterrestre TaxID=2950540 RepID=A0A9Q4Q027_9EURY|nr:hypothetical protein [Natrinema salsiterrestre]MDF9745860.1 hypothetical protein [Natrinema salsiterrestre]
MMLVIATLLTAMLRPEIAIFFWISASIGYALGQDIKKSLVSIGVLVGIISILPARLNPLSVSTLERIRRGRMRHGLSFLTDLSYDSWLDVFIYLPARLFYFTYSPFPWVREYYSMFILTFDSIYMIPVTVGAAITVLSGNVKFNHRTVFFIVFSMCVLGGYAVVISLVGVPARRRMYALPIYILAAKFVADQIVTRVTIE